MSALTDKAIVKKELLRDVAGKDKYQVNNKHDKEYTPLPLNKIIQRAEELVGQEVLYRLTSENCEHFVNELRYGVPRSDQVCPQSLHLTSGARSFPQLPVAGLQCGWRQNYKPGDNSLSICFLGTLRGVRGWGSQAGETAGQIPFLFDGRD